MNAKGFSSGGMEFQLGFGAPASARPTDDTPFRMAILADFSGRTNRGVCEANLTNRKAVAVDVDNFDELPAMLGTHLQIPVGGVDGPPVTLRFGELEDFEPDRIFEAQDVFQSLKGLRKRLQNSATFDTAAAEVRSWAPEQPDAAPSPNAPPDDGGAGSESDGDTLGRLLGKRPTGPVSAAAPTDGVNAMIRRIVGPHIVPGSDPQQCELISRVDDAITEQMRAILHHPDFQALEAAWRGLHLLVSQIETNETLKLYVVDVARHELAADVPDGDIQASAAYALFVGKTVGTPGAEPWSVLVANYTFGPDEGDVALLRHLGLISRAAGAILLAGADDHLADCESLAATPNPSDWQQTPTDEQAKALLALRQSPEAASIGLTLPRFLLRLPYGADTEPIDCFDFEELPTEPTHRQYLWGNAAHLTALLLAGAFSRSGWQLIAALGQEVAGLPMHVRKVAGERIVTPCAEALLTERAMTELLDRGLIPTLSIKGRDAVRIGQFRSLADPPTPLAGRWQ